MSQRHRVVIADFITGDLGPERQLLGEIADLVALDANSEQDLVGHVENADAIMLYHNISISRETIERLKNCKLIVRCGVGYDNVDFKFAHTRGIPVANVPDYGTEEVADSAIGLTLTLTRGIHLLNSIYRGGAEGWTFRTAVPIHRLRGRVFGVVGLGRIGTATALRAKALGMDVRFYDPLKPDGYDKALGIRRVDTLDELLGSAYVLSMHSPLTPDTKGMIGAAAIAKMPRGSYLVNTSRGAVVDTSAIPPAIASGHLAGAGIDVLATEPPDADDPLLVAWRDPKHLAYHRVIVNPHSAFYSEEGLLDMRLKGAKAVQNALCETLAKRRELTTQGTGSLMLDAAKSGWVIEVGDANFEEDVLQRSADMPVVLDFWAEWCEPCRQLGPMLEKQAAARKGGFVLAKVNVEEAQQLAGYFRIESIPAVLAFKGGQAVNGFVGMVAEPDLKEFLDNLAGPAANDPMVQAAAMEETEPTKAEAIYRDLIKADENNVPARLGLGRVLVANNRDEEALKAIETIPDAGELGPEAVKIRRTVEMRKNAVSAGDEEGLKQKVAANPTNPQLRLELGNVLATHGQYEPALQSLLAAAELDQELGRGAVRELMVKIFEIVGVRSELADKYRDKLRAMLY